MKYILCIFLLALAIYFLVRFLTSWAGFCQNCRSPRNWWIYKWITDIVNPQLEKPVRFKKCRNCGNIEDE